MFDDMNPDDEVLDVEGGILNEEALEEASGEEGFY